MRRSPLSPDQATDWLFIALRTMSEHKGFDYSKWDNIELSDDEKDLFMSRAIVTEGSFLIGRPGAKLK